MPSAATHTGSTHQEALIALPLRPVDLWHPLNAAPQNAPVRTTPSPFCQKHGCTIKNIWIGVP